jgi:hypothetical protein
MTVALEPKPAEVANAVDLCVGCGLCCDGTLFKNGEVVAEDQYEPLEPYVVDMFVEGEKSFFRQPCPYFDGTCCINYEGRFTVCRTFQCELLKSCRSGQTDWTQAKAVVVEAQKLIATARSCGNEAVSYEYRRTQRAALAEELQQVAPDERRRCGQKLLSLVALGTFLERWFYLSEQQVDKS